MKKYAVPVDEYSARVRTIICDMPLKAHPYAKAGIDKRGASISLWSYATCAAEINNGWLSVHCLSTNTTRHHVSAFLREYAPRLSYYDAKLCFEHDTEMHIETGVLRKPNAA